MTHQHPPGLRTLFFTEMWERFSYYGMRGLLVLFMTRAIDGAADPEHAGQVISNGGMGLSIATASAIYGLYTAAVYLSALPGGWLADRLLGAQRTVWCGGLMIAAGHFTLAIPRHDTFYLGLLLVAIGSGLLKTSMSTLVGGLYPEGGGRRDAGFTIFYMGINIGAFIGPFLCSWLGERFAWHWGFATAGVGMLLGLIQYQLTRHRLGDNGLVAPFRNANSTRDQLLVVGALAGLLALVLSVVSGLLVIEPIAASKVGKWVILSVAIAYFAWAFLLAGLNSDEKKRLVVIAVLFSSAVLFFAGFEQVGSSLTIFAEQHTNCRLPFSNRDFPTGWFNLVNPALVVLLAPMLAALWLRLSRANQDPNLIAKMALGLLLMAAGFGVIALGAQACGAGKVTPLWLVGTYLLHTIGELCLSPVGLSSVTKLAPARLGGQMMGVWFLGTSLGNLLAGLFAGEVAGAGSAALSAGFTQVMWVSGAAGLLLLLVSKPLSKLMRGVV